MSGGKGGSSTSEVKIPEYIEAAAQRNLNKAERISQIGYVPQYGPDVAAFTPMQQASFQNTSDAANAFGMASPTSQRDIMGGMDAPTTYANGVSGYSSAPMYQQSIDALAAARPAQKSYIDSFFIDPTTGNYAYTPMDYTNYATNAANERAAAAAASSSSDGGNNSNTSGGGAYLGPNPDGSAGYDKGFVSIGDMFDGGGPGASGVGYTGLLDMVDGGGPSASTIGGRDYAGPNPDGSAGNDGPGGGGFVSIGDMFDGGGPGASGKSSAPSNVSNASSQTIKSGDTLSAIAKREGTTVNELMKANPQITDKNKINAGASITIPKSTTASSSSSGSSGSSSSSGGGGGCVVATHAVESGAFTPQMKREAVVWCMESLHGKWWGEAVRRGYRHLGRKKIEQGKAREHYVEFSRYIQFANGKKRNPRGALTFALRTAQFFAVGLIKKDA